MGIRILLAVDGSPHSKSAAQLAIQLVAASEGGELAVIHVISVVESTGNLIHDLPGQLGFEPAVVSSEVFTEHEQHGAKVIDEVKALAEHSGVQIRMLLEQGAVVERIAYWAQQYDFVMVGMRGETEARFPGQGGTYVHALVDTLNVPCLFVPVGATRMTGAAVGYDGSEGSRASLKVLSPIVRALKVPVHAIFVGAESDSNLHEVPEQLPGVKVIPHVQTGSPVHQILAQTARKSEANLLCLGFHGKSKLKDFLFGTAADYLLDQANLIVLVAH